MRRLFLVLITIVTVAAACGSDTDSTTDVGADPTDTSNSNSGDATGPSDDLTDDGDVLGAGPYPIADLIIEVQPDGTAAGTVSYRLACLGDTATLTGDTAPGSADSMCLALNDDPARTRLLAGAPTDQLCTEIYGGPQLATITGTLDGASVATSVDRANGCGIDDWDRLLSVFLPTA